MRGEYRGNNHDICRLMDKITRFGRVDRGSIPFGYKTFCGLMARRPFWVWVILVRFQAR
jgi:hypothetical protein